MSNSWTVFWHMHCHCQLTVQCFLMSTNLILLSGLSHGRSFATIRQSCGCTYDMRLPPGIQGFSKLNSLEYCMESLVCQDLADLRHIPNVKVVSMDRDNARGHQRAKLQLTRGSWQSLEVYFLGGLSLNIKDVDSFVKDTESFTFSSENTHGSSNLLYQKIQKACSKHGKSCHLSTHTGAVYGEQRMYVTLSTSKYVAENCPVYNDGMGPAFNFDRSLSHVDNFWPCDPFASVRWE